MRERRTVGDFRGWYAVVLAGLLLSAPAADLRADDSPGREPNEPARYVRGAVGGAAIYGGPEVCVGVGQFHSVSASSALGWTTELAYRSGELDAGDAEYKNLKSIN
jgi:hypothetical protein